MSARLIIATHVLNGRRAGLPPTEYRRKLLNTPMIADFRGRERTPAAPQSYFNENLVL